VHRLSRIAGVAVLVAIPIGFVGAWAFDPDSGVVLHSEILWRIFGIMCEGGLVLVVALVVLAALFAAIRKILALAGSVHA
jgi:hypothetical protein